MSVQIEFDKPRALKFTLGAIRDLEAALDKPLAAIVVEIQRLGINAFVHALHCGLKHEDKGLSANLVTKMLEAYLEKGGNLHPIARAIDAALIETGIFRDEADEGNAPPEQASQ